MDIPVGIEIEFVSHQELLENNKKNIAINPLSILFEEEIKPVDIKNNKPIINASVLLSEKIFAILYIKTIIPIENICITNLEI